MPEITLSAPGKTILHGEHSVVYGKAAIALSLGLRTTVTLNTTCEGHLEMNFQSLNFYKKLKLPALINMNVSGDTGPDIILASETYLKDMLDLLNNDLPPESMKQQAVTTLLFLYSSMTQKYGNGIPKGASVTLTSELPIGAGLGSSASFSVSLATAFLYLYGQVEHSSVISDDDLSLINKWAFQAETILHGKPSGIDNSICTYGGALLFQQGKVVGNIPKLPKIKILLINTDVPRNTKMLVENVRQKVNKHPEIFEPIFESMEAISLKQWNLLRETSCEDQPGTDLCINSDLIVMNHHILNCIGAGHPKLDQIFQLASSLGLPAKLTGAGGGGCALVFVTGDKEVSDVKRIFSDASFNVCTTELAGKGISFE